MTATLRIGDEQTTVRIEGEGQEPRLVVLAVGLLSLSRQHFHHEPMTAGELEAAIETVEDALMPAIPRLRGPGPLLTSDAESVALVEAAGQFAGADVELDLATVERVFNRLANVANGRSAASEGLPGRGRFAANLLILRELMHHAGRATIQVQGPVPPTR